MAVLILIGNGKVLPVEEVPVVAPNADENVVREVNLNLNVDVDDVLILETGKAGLWLIIQDSHNRMDAAEKAVDVNVRGISRGGYKEM